MSGVYGMKPKLLLNLGISYAATSPLHYTLGWDNQYCHTGHCKEHQYLYILQKGIKSWGKKHPPKKNVKKDSRYTGTGCFEKYPPLTCESQILKGFDMDIIEQFFRCGRTTNIKSTCFCDKGGYSIEHYIDYYKELWRCVQGQFHAVADFSNQGFLLDEQFMMSIRDRLLEEFDIKITMLFRDPVRRLFSRTSKTSQYFYDMTPLEYFKFHIEDHLDDNMHYAENYEKFVRVWGKDRVHPIVMEELWSDSQKVNDLAMFLEFPITKLHENCYYPDKGQNAPKYEYLSDQWCTNTVALDKQTWEFGMAHLNWVYDNFKQTFGYIPSKWGVWYET